MAIQDDFTIFPFTKVIRHDPTKSTVYTAVQFYSFIQDAFDEPGFLSYETAMRFNTPESFTMLNGWFLDDGDGSNILQHITGGGIDTLGYGTISDPVLMIDLDYSQRSFILSDLDKTITHDGTDIGPLLSFKDDYRLGSQARIWVRDTNDGAQTVSSSELIDVSAGDGNYTAAGSSAKGDNIYHNLFTIAAFPGTPDPQLYVYQNHPVDGTRTRISEWSAFTNWDRSSTGIDILVTTQLAGSLIDGGSITTFVRQTGDTFTFVESTLTTSGRTPIATETAADGVNITEGEHYLLYDTSNDGSFSIGDVITDVPFGTLDTDLTPPAWYAEVVAVTQFSGDATGLLELRSLRGSITTADAIYVGATKEAQANGQPGDTLISYTGTDPATLEQTITGDTSTARRILRGFDTDADRMVCQDDPDITGTSRNVYYKDFDSGEAMTGGSDGALGTTSAVSVTIISGFNDVTVAHMNGTVVVDTFGGAFIEGERITWTGGEGIMIQTDASTIMMLGNVTAETGLNDDSTPTVITGDLSSATCEIASSAGMTDDNTQNFEFSLQTTGALYSVFIEGGFIYEAGRSLTDIYAYLQYYVRDGQSISDRIIYTSDSTAITELAGEEYFRADPAYNATKAAPFGTLAGGVFFGAVAVWLEGMAAADNNNINLTDTNAAKDTFLLRQPFTAITITVSNTRQFDRVAIFLESGSTELPNKAQYTSDNSANTLDGTTFARDSGAFPNDTPTINGTFIVLDSVLDKQHRYRFATRNGTTDPGVLTVPSVITGTTDGATADQTLIDLSETFQAAVVKIGDIIHRKNRSLGFAYVTAIVSETELTTTLIEDTTGTAIVDWATGDTYDIYSLVKTYTNSDTFFIPYMDEIETASGQIDVNLTYVADREIILEVRNVKAATEIVPFKTTGQILVSGYSQGVIRNEDTVFTP